MRKIALFALCLSLPLLAAAAEDKAAPGEPAAATVNYEEWHAGNDVSNTARNPYDPSFG